MARILRQALEDAEAGAASNEATARILVQAAAETHYVGEEQSLLTAAQVYATLTQAEATRTLADAVLAEGGDMLAALDARTAVR